MGHMSDDDASAPPAAVTGGVDCDQSSDQQGHVLPFSHDPELICLTEGCNRRRRRYFETGYTRYRWRIGTHCCRDCVIHSHCSSCREVGPQPSQNFYGTVGSFEDHEMSPANQCLIIPPEPPQTTLVPRLEQDEKADEDFFVTGGARRCCRRLHRRWRRRRALSGADR